ncbi:hypothetical protein [Planobispora takensis]|nr:hypothetical protein [Planobispora takensis]
MIISLGLHASTRYFVWTPGGLPAPEDYMYGLRHLTGSSSNF